MRKPRTLAAAAAFAIGMAGCGTAAAARPPLVPGPGSRAQVAMARAYGAADTAFGLRVLGTWCRSRPRANIVFSPASLAAGLGLAYLGARGQTAAAMARTLHLPVTGRPQAEAGMRARQSELGRHGPGVTLAASNRVWSDPSLPPLRSYLDAAALAYHAGLSRVPLLADPTRAAQIINAAVGRDTHGKIPQLLGPGALAGDAWVLTDALFMSADWARPFPASRTAPGRFATAAGGAATARFMHGAGYRYATAGGWTAAALPYRGGRLTMTALLPRSGRGALGCQLPPAAALRTLDSALARAGPAAAIALPKVSLVSRRDMNGLLTRLGMGIAFGGLADFTGLSPRACCIALVEHAATLQVGEKGTVGSAATAVGLVPTDAQVPAGPQIAFDRPYLMLVTDTATGEPLFLARVADPGG